MAGRKNRPRRMDEVSRTWNIVFPVRLIEKIKAKAAERSITAASLVREELDAPSETNSSGLKEKIFAIIRKEFRPWVIRLLIRWKRDFKKKESG